MNSYTSKILLISGNKSDQDVIGRMLETENLVPIFASEAQTGLEQAFRARPQLALVDLPPGTANIDLCKRLRASHVRIPIVVLSPIGDELEKVLLLEIGADDYVVKPFSQRELLARIRALLRRAQENTDLRASISLSRA